MKINFIGVPIFYGSDIKGADYSPNKLREKNIFNKINNNIHEIYDLGNIYVPHVDESEKYASHPKMKYLDPIVNVNRNLAHFVYTSLKSNCFPFVLGGDHSIGLGSICGASKFEKNLAVIWIDAHGDINTDLTTNSGNVHGMPLAAAMGIGPNKLTNIYFEGQKVKPENVFIIGARSLDEGEENLISEKNLNLYSTNNIKQNGIKPITNDIIKKLSDNNISHIHLSFDIDCLDSSIVPGTGTPVSRGLTFDEVKSILKDIFDTKLVKSMDLVELNTLLDKNEKTTDLVLELIKWTFEQFD